MNRPVGNQAILRLFACLALVGAVATGGARKLASQQQPPPSADSSQHQLAPGVRAFVTQLPKLMNGTVAEILPSDADPTIKRFNAPNIIAYRNDVKPDAPLLVWFSGTGGTPIGGWLFIKAAAEAGYRVIGLTYDNGISDPQACGPNPDPACADRFREKRIFGDADSAEIDDQPNESVMNRLMHLLHYLEKTQPDQHWGQYLKSALPDWSRMAVAGHSQGGGVAAYIGKKRKVLRVINLSGAWDRTEQGSKDWAPWITSASATPMDRWYCAYHAKEKNAEPMKAAYAAMNVPPDHIRVLTLEPIPQPTLPPGGDAYHGSMISEKSTPRDANGEPAYAGDWAFMLGTPR